MLNEQEKRDFVCELVSEIKADILEKVSRMPLDWDGIELREYIAERFASSRWSMTRTRRASFDNAILTQNL